MSPEATAKLIAELEAARDELAKVAPDAAARADAALANARAQMPRPTDDATDPEMLLRICARLRITVTPDGYISTAGTASFIGNVSPKTLRKWRKMEPPRGPACRKNSGPSGHGYYRLRDVAAWKSANRAETENK